MGLYKNSPCEGEAFVSKPAAGFSDFSAFLSSAAIKLRSKKLKYVVFALVILMMLSRMYLGVHFLEDVLVAAVFGLLIAYGINYIHNKYSSNQVLLHRISFLHPECSYIG